MRLMELALLVVVIVACTLIIGFVAFKDKSKNNISKYLNSSKTVKTLEPYYSGCDKTNENKREARLINLDLTVYEDDKVSENEPISIVTGRPSFARTREGDYAIEVFDAQGDILWCNYFDLYYDYTGPVVLGQDYSKIKYSTADLSMRIPYVYEMQTIKIWHRSSLIFNKDL